MQTQTFTDAQLETLHALTDCILPADDYPGGWDAGTEEYLTRFLAREPQFLPVYLQGLDALAADGFLELAPDAQNACLSALDADPERGAFFRLLTAHILEGFYADPGNGGNKDGISWQMIGFRVTA